MFKKFNFTGKKRLLWKGENPDLIVNLDEISPFESKIKILLLIEKYLQKYPGARVSVEVYQARSAIRTELGSVSEVCKFDKEFDIDTAEFEPSKIRVRVKISEEKTGKIIAYADRIKPEQLIKDEGERKKRKAYQSSIFTLRASNLIGVPFTVDIQANERPVVLCNAKLNFRERLSQDAKLQYILLPTILRETYYRYFLEEELHDDTWFLQLINFGEKIIDKPASLSRNEENKIIFNDDLAEWINDVCNAFSSKNRFITQLEDIFRKEE